ncbi:MAG: YfhO family protein, partial [Chloroflexota bacterium]
GLFYPINVLVFLLVPTITVHTLQYLAVFHFWLAGFGMYLYLQHSPLAKRYNITPIAAFAGAIIFEFSDLFIVHFGNLNMIAVAAWLPLILLTFQLGITEKRLGMILASGSLLAVATLASHIQITLFILLALGLFTLWHWFVNDRVIKVERSHRQYAVGYLLITVLVMMGLSSLWLIPTLEMSRYTLRTDLTYDEAAAFSLHPPQLIGLLVPTYFGRDPALHWGPWDRVETGYVGILTLLLALLAIVFPAGKQTKFIIFLTAISFLLALGENSILHSWLSLSPGFGQFRAPARYILLMDFGLAALAALGLNRLMLSLSALEKQRFSTVLKVTTWLMGGILVVSLPLAYYALLITQDRNPEIFRRVSAATDGITTFALLITISLLMLYFVYWGRLRSHTLGVVASVIIMFDLFSLGANVDVGHADPTIGFNHPEAIQFLQNEGINRIEVTTDIWHLWQPDTALLANLYDSWGVYNPLTLADMTRYWQQVWPRSSSRYNFLGLKHIVASKAGAPADGNIVPVFDADPQVNVYLNLDALPRVLFVPQAHYVDSHEAAWEAIRAPAFNAQDTVVLESVPTTNQQNTSATLADNPNLGIALLRYDLHTIEIGLTTDTSGYLVLSDTHYPGWQATVDGQAAPIYKANYAFRAVPVPAGVHTVRMVFQPWSWRIGLVVSTVTFAGLMLYVIRKWRFMRRSSPQNP